MTRVADVVGKYRGAKACGKFQSTIVVRTRSAGGGAAGRLRKNRGAAETRDAQKCNRGETRRIADG